MKHPELYPMMERADDCSNILLSLGVGVQPPVAEPGWSVDTYQPPLIITLIVSSKLATQNAITFVFRHMLTPDMDQPDNATEENLTNLVKCAEDMIHGNIKRLNPVTFKLEPIDDTITYKQELIRFAKILSDERKNRLTL
ncbi:hypothetical protein PIB30_070539 [Stylosanthes scabra]|uniref:Uncharacterized protein n=1 Tax=Stylosanthes scabra TaxID=79078 RepID=A0ABU6UNG7_9FABA|nr:hypothetical protein [Stylosanthes scabra]